MLQSQLAAWKAHRVPVLAEDGSGMTDWGWGSLQDLGQGVSSRLLLQCFLAASKPREWLGWGSSGPLFAMLP